VVAGLAVLRPAVEVEPAVSQRPVVEAGKLDFQRFGEEAALAGSEVAAESLTRPVPQSPLDGRFAERLFHARAEDGHHHLLERTEESLVVLA
jgi:hypothetical protein